MLVLILWLREYVAEGAFPSWGLVAVPAAVLIIIVVGYTTAREMPALVGIRRAWRRAEHGEVVRVVRGVALRQVRSVSDVPVRTVVAPVDGRLHFVRLAFARVEDAARLPAGPVQVDLFDAPAVRGPARLRPVRGGGLGEPVWAFAVRKGDAAEAEAAPWTVENEQSDGWPDGDGAADGETGWPGDGDGDGDGGE